MKCCFRNCSNMGTLFCVCESRTESLCAHHIVNHLSGTTEKKNHKVFSAVKFLANDDKPILLKFIEYSIKNLKKTKIELFSKINQLLDIGSNSIKIMDNLIEYMKRVMREIIMNNEATIIPSSNRKYRNNKISEEMLRLSFKDQLKHSKINDLIIKIDQLKNDLNEIQRSSNKFKNSKILPFFLNNSKTLLLMDIKNETLLKKEFLNIETQGKRAGILFLNKNNIFCYGGYFRSSLCSAYIIDCNNFSIIQIPKSIPRASFTPVKVNNSIYCFGGWNSSPLDSADYFDLIENKWIKISNLPTPQSDTSTSKVGNNIIITGNFNFLQIYLINSNLYNDINPGIEINANNIIIKFQGMIYLLCKKVYYSNKYKLKKWVSLPENHVYFGMLSCIPIIRNYCAYFIDTDMKIWVFNLMDFKIKFLTQVEKFS